MPTLMLGPEDHSRWKEHLTFQHLPDVALSEFWFLSAYENAANLFFSDHDNIEPPNPGLISPFH